MSGMDAMLNDNWRIGGALGYARFRRERRGWALAHPPTSTAISFAAYTSGQGRLVRGARRRRGGRGSNIDTNRSVVFPGFFESVEASYNGNTGQVFGEVALPLAHSQHRLASRSPGSPGWGVDTGGFRETGGDAALSSNGGLRQRRLHDALARASPARCSFVAPRSVPRGFGCVAPRIRRRRSRIRALPSRHSGRASSYPACRWRRIARWSMRVSICLLAPDATLGIFYTGQFADNVQDNAVSGRVDWRF